MKKELYLGMSGGVDSSTAALLANKAGYGVIGVTHIVCGDGTEAERAALLCSSLGIPHEILDLREVFKREVEEYFVSSYERGETPNPCVICNKTVKFPYLFEKAGESAEVATGHYARIEKCGSRLAIKKGADPKKDQSYMLWTLSQDQLSRLYFPLGDLTKEEVRAIAAESGLECASKRDSQDICFIPDGDYASFIRSFRGYDFREGDYVDINGNYLGKHSGHMNYTPGQGRGLGIALGKHMYVVSKNAENNTVVLGDKSDIMKKEVRASGINFMASGDLSSPERLSAKIRYGKSDTPALVYRSGEDEITAVFDEAVTAPAAGQSLVVYDGDTVVCGGTIKI